MPTCAPPAALETPPVVEGRSSGTASSPEAALLQHGDSPRAPEPRLSHGGGGAGGRHYGGDRGRGGGGGSGPLCPRCGVYTVGRYPLFYGKEGAICVICGTDEMDRFRNG